mgnify:CR=1 FL=1
MPDFFNEQAKTDQKWMKRVFALAEGGIGHVNPNPLVGAIIIQDDELISEGYHHKFGADHAEIEAIKRCKVPIESATLYVNLEPCSHTGKTPSCAQEIIKHDFKRVVISNQDPNPLVSGRGIQILKNAGIEVVSDILREDGKELNKHFFKYITKKRPYVILKSAMSLDGKIATHTGDSKWITNENSRALVHELRHHFSALITGANTIVKDNPILNTRNGLSNPSHPKRIILDPDLICPVESKVFNTPEYGQTILVVNKENMKRAKIKFAASSVDIWECEIQNNSFNLDLLVRKCGAVGISSLMIEAGGNTNFEFIKQGIVDQLNLFIAPKIIGGDQAVTPFEGIGVDRLSDAYECKNINYSQIGSDLLIQAEF